ncbi:MAG: hypothetical protein C6H99_00030 [Epsilonproteobacteria bacterium]|nr:hypothetical protein [Campylobacterota bacterium]NPA65229.1 hypothetical protein [Campylobacterota bacterium]
MRIFLLILPLFLLAAPCSKCDLNRAEMKCNYYVAKKGEKAYAKECLDYAEYLDSTKVYGKAAWYYLLGLAPKKAFAAAQKAVQMNEGYAYEYMGDVALMRGEEQKAREYYKKFKRSVGNTEFFTSRSFEVLQKLYPNFDVKKARELMK